MRDREESPPVSHVGRDISSVGLRLWTPHLLGQGGVGIHVADESTGEQYKIACRRLRPQSQLHGSRRLFEDGMALSAHRYSYGLIHT